MRPCPTAACIPEASVTLHPILRETENDSQLAHDLFVAFADLFIMTSLISDPWGVILIGCYISLILFGIVVVQAFTYFQECEKDPLWQKSFVGVLILLDVLSSALAMAWMYQLLIDGWGEIAAFEKANWLLAADFILAGVVACMVQLFFAWRLHSIAFQRWLTVFVIIFSFITFCGGVGTGIAVLWVKNYALFGTFKEIVMLWLIPAAITDITITMALTVHLRRHKGNLAATDQLLDRIIQFTIQNGFMTAIVAVVDVCLYLATPKIYHISISFLLPKLYSNTVLSLLNSRQTLRPPADATVESHSESSSRPIDMITFGAPQSSQMYPSRPQVSGKVHETTDSSDATSEWK